MRFHPWIFSGGIRRIDGEPEEGDIVEVFGESGKFLCKGHYHRGSISVRVLSYEQEEFDQAFWTERIRKAYGHRQDWVCAEGTNVYRLINASGDRMPGLIIDIYGDAAVLQAHTVGMHRLFPTIAHALREIYGAELQTIYDKSAKTLKANSGYEQEDGFLLGSEEEAEVLEDGNRYLVDWVKGQKTGFFIDQRDNRKKLASYCAGKKVLNTFCYTGGFSVSALGGGARLVHSVDSSQKAIDLTRRNMALNGLDQKHEAYCADVFEFLQESSEEYEVIVLDPPAFAKNVKTRHKAVKGYIRLNKIAMSKISSGGLIMTFSCSQVIDRALFANTIRAAGIEAGRQMRILAELGAGLDHPINLFHQEGEYLKGLLVQVF